MSHRNSSLGLLRAIACALGCTALACSTPESAASNGEVVGSDGELERAAAANPALRTAIQAIEAGHPWKATVALSPMLGRSPGNRAVVLVAARAAAAWDGWSEVEKLLAHESWLDSSFAGEGRELLARADLAANSTPAAIQNAEAAVHRATDAKGRAVREIYLA